MKHTKFFLTQGLTLSLFITIVACHKQITNNDTVAVSAEKTSLNDTKRSFVSISGVNRQLMNSAFDPSGRLEIKIWADYVDGNVNHAEVSVDPDFVLVGGGARITNLFNTETGVNALLTSEYPKDDATFSTFVSESKDHWSAYYHRLWVYAIGMKLYDANMQPISASNVKSHMNISKVTSGYSNRPSARVYVPNGYNLLSGGAHIIWNHPGVLLVASTGSIPTNGTPAAWYAEGKDHVVSATGAIEAYALSFDNNIPNFGNMLFRSRVDHLINNNNHVVAGSLNVDNDNSGYLLTGIGGWAIYDGFGRLIYSKYPMTSKSGWLGTKDHYTSDLSGGLTSIAVTGIRRQ